MIPRKKENQEKALNAVLLSENWWKDIIQMQMSFFKSNKTDSGK